jgi:multiple sugar transport system permease protein
VDTPLVGERVPWLARHRKGRAKYLFLLPALVALALTAVYPLVFAIITSFLNWNLTSDRGVKWAGFAEFKQAFEYAGFGGSLVRTIVFVIVAVVIEVGLGVCLALLLNRAFRMRGIVVALLSLPMMLTPVALAYMWKYMYDADVGVIDAVLQAVGLGRPVWLQSVNPPWLTFAAMVQVDVWEWTPFVTLLCLAALSGIPRDIIEATALDGASWRRLYWDILIPLIRPTIVVAALIRTITAFKEFDQIFIMTKGGPGSSTTLVSYDIFVTGFQYFNMGETGVMGITLFALTALLAVAFLFFASRRGRG